MSQPKRESHLRSLLKGISWRIVATLDSIVVVLLVTWLWDGKPSIEYALKFAGWEFLLKYIVYYFHERIWEQFRSGSGLDSSRTFKKSISWRIVATTMTCLIASAYFGTTLTTGIIATVEFFSKFALYYVHERVWLKLPLGRIRRLLGRK